MYYASFFMTLPEYLRLRETSTTSKRPHPETDMGESPAESDLLTVVENLMYGFTLILHQLKALNVCFNKHAILAWSQADC